MKNLFTSLENVEQDVQPAVDFDQLLENQKDINDIETEGREIDKLGTVLENVFIEEETLTKIHSSLNEKLESEEIIAPETVEIAEIAIEAIYKKLGIKVNNTTLPAIENFKSQNTAKQSFHVAVESIGETLSNIWQKIIDFMKMIWKKIQAVFSKIFDRKKKVSDQTEEKIKILKTGIQKKKGYFQISEDLQQPFLLRTGRFDPSQIIHNTEELLDQTHTAAKEIKAAISGLESLVNSSNPKSFELDYFSNFSSMTSDIVIDFVPTISGVEYVDGITYQKIYPVEGASFWEKTKREVVIKPNHSLEQISKDDMLKLLEKAKNLNKKASSFDANKELQSMFEAIEKMAERAKKKVYRSEEWTKQQSQNAIDSIRSVMRDIQTLLTKFSQHVRDVDVIAIRTSVVVNQLASKFQSEDEIEWKK